MTPSNGRAPFLSIAVLSAAALGYEILLMRLFSIIQWHHFAYMIISLALLGYGVSGTFLAVAQRRLLPRFPAAYIINVLLFAASAVGCYLLAQNIPFNAEEILWDPRQPLRLLAIYLLLALPFFFAANGVALALMHASSNVSRVYAVDLLGAGLGSLGVIGILFVLQPLDALLAVGILGAASAVVAAWELRIRLRTRGSIAVLVAVLAGAGILAEPQLAISPYKALSQVLRIPGARVIDTRSSPLGLLHVVESTRVPLRHAPGLSIRAERPPPQQLGLFTDADNMTAIARSVAEREALDYLDQLTSALPYHLGPLRRVLVLGAGGGADVLQAGYHGAVQIDAVELNAQLADLVRNNYAEFAGHLYDAAGVRLHVAEARGFVAESEQRFDLIQLALLDSFSASAAGLYALNESYLYTVEALESYVAHLAPGGYLSITRWVKLPPRDTLKLFATAAQALRRTGTDDPGAQLALIRGWQTSTLLVKRGRFDGQEIAALRAFCKSRSFDVAYYPGIEPEVANRYNILDKPYFLQGARAILGEHPETFFQRYKFNLRPATDDRPYFFHFFKWRVMPEILTLRGRGGLPLLEWGYLVLVATLVQAVLLSVLLILAPLRFYRHHRRELALGISRVRTLIYFLVVGLAFLFVEIAFIQKFILFLHHPLYAAAAVLTAFLVFAGLGSAASSRLAQRRGRHAAATIAITGIALLAISYAAALGPLFAALGGLPVAARAASSIALIAPLAFCMGMPFPLALANLGTHAPALIPWAWGVNGCASVISAALATLLAIQFGFTAVILLAVMLYGVAALAFPKEKKTVAGQQSTS